MPSEGGSSRHAGGGGGEGGGILFTPRLLDCEGTRARPLKPFESEPFLTIGTTDLYTHRTPSSRQTSVHGGATLKGRPGSGDSRHSDGQGQRSTPVSAGAFLYGLFASETLSVGKENSRSGGHTSPSRMPASSFTSFQPSPNPRIKMPFKHDIRKPSQAQWQEPSQELKEMTVLATYHMTQMLDSDGDTLTQKQQGRLRKGKLKPLYPVNVTGPSIRQCRGILSETRSYSASASRTLQRRRHIVTQLKSGALSLGVASTTRLHDDTESVHRVSAASSVEDLTADGDGKVDVGGDEKLLLNDDFQAELASMERDALLAEDMLEDKASLSKGTSAGSREEPAHKGVTTTPLSPDPGSLQNPDLSSPNPAPEASTSVKKERKGKKETHNAKALSSEISVRVTSSGKNSTMEAAGSFSCNGKEGQSPSRVKQIDRINKNTRHSSMRGRPPHTAPPTSKRPLSAGVRSSDCLLTTSQAKVRPQTATLLKTVRFADHAHSSDGKRLPVSRSNNWMGKGRGAKGEDKLGTKERKNASGESCKPYDQGKGHRADDDDDDRKSGEREGMWGGGTGGSTRTDSNKMTSQGGQTTPVSNSQPAPQDEVTTASFSDHSYILYKDFGVFINDGDFVDSGCSPEHQQCTSEQRNKESKTAHREDMSDVQNYSHTKNEAGSTATSQYSNPQKLDFMWDTESERPMGYTEDPSPQNFSQEKQQNLPVTGEEMMDLQKLQGNQEATANHDTDISVLHDYTCVQDNMRYISHLMRGGVDLGDKSDLVEKLIELKNNCFDVGRDNEDYRAEFSDSKTTKLQQWWTLLGVQFNRWFASVLVL